MTPPRVVIVTGTDTEVGKTVATAALAVLESQRASVAVFKPAQTGVGAGEAGDVDEVRRLSGLDSVFEGCRLRDPLAPTVAARREGVSLPTVADHARAIERLLGTYDTVIVEGAGGLLVGLDGDGHGLLELADSLEPSCGFVVVARAGLGTLNHTALTVDALRHRGQTVLGVVIGADPVEPGLAETCNLVDLPRVTGASLIGRIPERAGELSTEAFCSHTPKWFTSWPVST